MLEFFTQFFIFFLSPDRLRQTSLNLTQIYKLTPMHFTQDFFFLFFHAFSMLMPNFCHLYTLILCYMYFDPPIYLLLYNRETGTLLALQSAVYLEAKKCRTDRFISYNVWHFASNKSEREQVLSILSVSQCCRLLCLIII